MHRPRLESRGGRPAWRPAVAAMLLAAASLDLPQVAAAEEHPVVPYADPAQLDCPWPKHSHYKQPWRGFLETRSGHDFLQGLGVNYHVPRNDELAVRLLAETGFKTFRIEIGFGSVRWEEDGLANEDRMRKLLVLCKRHGIRPTMLLNAHQGVPCPVRFFSKKLVEDAPAGSRAVKLADVEGLVIGRSGLSGLTDYWAAEALVTSIDEPSGVCTLSKPLPKALKAGNVSMATLKYLPLHPVGTREFDESADGWVRYALRICRLVEGSGIDEFDVEIWNELTFGTRWLDVGNYYAKDAPKAPRGPDFLNRGGTCWELARRTVEAVKREYPRTRCIWGFSNTTFYHCAIENLPPGTDGQSYHPYGTGARNLPEREPHKDRPELNLEGYTPNLDVRMPEGWAYTFIQTECLMRLLNPEARLARKPDGVERFYHYITEHGVVPAECGVRDEPGQWRLKALCATRSFCLWLHKGVDVMHYFVAYADKSSGMGILPQGLPELPADAAFDEVATPPMRAVRNLAGALAGSTPLEATRPLQVELVALGSQTKVFEGDGAHPPLWHREVLAVLPFQCAENRFVVPVFVMTYDATRPIEPQRYRVALRGVRGAGAVVSLYDPHEDRPVECRATRRDDDLLEVELPAVGHPRLLEIRESP